MKLESIDVDAAIDSTRRLLDEERNVSPALKASVELLLTLVTLLINRLGLNSGNSSKPPSSDPNRKKKKKERGGKPGGQKGHKGATLNKVENPDVVRNIPVDKVSLPEGEYREAGYEVRQVIDIDISQVVTEYRAQILEGADGKRHTAPFPEGVNRPVQYGISIKAHAVYLSQHQLIPYNRIEETFRDQADIPVSTGSIYNFNEEACDRLEDFEAAVRSELINADVCHADETGINIDGKRRWLHCVSNDEWTLFLPHEKRGADAMNDMGVLPRFTGVLCHDHWKPYFKFGCSHALCNAHHLRELQRAWEQDGQQWAADVRELLLEMNAAVDDAGGRLPPEASLKFRHRYRALLKTAQTGCPPPDETQRKGKRGRLKRSKARNLLERLIDYEDETLRFMDDEKVPFTDNQGGKRHPDDRSSAENIGMFPFHERRGNILPCPGVPSNMQEARRNSE